MIEFLHGDMFREKAIAHGCNCRGVMGAGVARTVLQRFPAAYVDYRKLCESGRFQLGSVHHWAGGDYDVFNLGTQIEPGPHASITAISGALVSLMAMAEGAGVGIIGMPQIGCGIGGLRWTEVQPIMLRACADSTRVTVRVYSR